MGDYWTGFDVEPITLAEFRRMQEDADRIYEEMFWKAVRAQARMTGGLGHPMHYHDAEDVVDDG